MLLSCRVSKFSFHFLLLKLFLAVGKSVLQLSTNC